MFPETKSRETLSFEGKQNYFPREQTLSVLLYSDEIKKIYIFIQQLYFVVKTTQSKRFLNLKTCVKDFHSISCCLLCFFVSFRFCSL